MLPAIWLGGLNLGWSLRSEHPRMGSSGSGNGPNEEGGARPGRLGLFMSISFSGRAIRQAGFPLYRSE
jgi:hypothetical protein